MEVKRLLLFFGFLGVAEFVLEVDGVSRNVLTALGEEDPSKDIEGETKDKEDDFDRNWPGGSKEDGGVDAS